MNELTRIVRLSFDESKVADFIHIFESSKNKIRSFPGCLHLELMTDFESPHIYYTISKWQSNIDLQNYRNSELFKTIWSKTKLLFNEKPLVYSLSNSNIG